MALSFRQIRLRIALLIFQILTKIFMKGLQIEIEIVSKLTALVFSKIDECPDEPIYDDFFDKFSDTYENLDNDEY